MNTIYKKACYVRSIRPDRSGNVTMPQEIALLLAEKLIDRSDYERAFADRSHCERTLFDEQQAHQQTIRVLTDEIQHLKAENTLIADSYKRAHEEVVRLRMERRNDGVAHGR